jgi:hypothetical protein
MLDDAVDLDQFSTMYEDEDYLVKFEPSTEVAAPGDLVPICYAVDAGQEIGGNEAWWLIDRPTRVARNIGSNCSTASHGARRQGVSFSEMCGQLSRLVLPAEVRLQDRDSKGLRRPGVSLLYVERALNAVAYDWTARRHAQGR